MTHGNDELGGVDEEDFVDELKPGTELMLGQYTIKDFLAAGGFGITYLASDSLGRNLVIKECFPGNFCRRQNHSVMPRSRSHQEELKSITRLFSQEAHSLSKAGHPNIVGVHQVFEENNTAYMALDYVEGQDLLEILKDDPDSLTPERIEKFLTKILDAIAHVHGKGILHRDISPDNILIRKDDEPVLIDFGAARESKDEKASRLLSALRVVKDGYSPQEFYIAGSEQGPSCDLYSLAASFYHLITGELPPDSQTRLSAFAAGEPDPYVPLAKQTKAYSKAFTTALDKAMSVLPKERMQSAEEWKAHMGGNAPAKTAPGRPANTDRPAKSTSMVPLILGGSVAAAAVGAGVLFVSGTPTPDETAPLAKTQQTAEASEAVDAPDMQDATPVETAEAPVEAAPFSPAPEVTAVEPTEVAAVDPEPVDQPETAPLPFEMALAPVETLAPPKVEPVVPAPVTSEPEVTVDDDADPEFMRLLAQAAQTPVVASPQPEVAVAAPEAAETEMELGTMDAASVMEVVAPRLPFTLDDEMPGVIASVSDGAPDWLTVGTRILSVNGKAAATNAELLVQINETSAGSVGEATLWFGLDAGLGEALIERALTVETETQTVLLNGLAFVTSTEAGEVVTRVSSAPSGSNFQVGDRVVAFMATGEKIAGDVTIKSILERELEAGRTSFSFAVDREGEMWVEDFNLAALSQ